jgi:tRNA (cytidine/uridine-2'-O-)-methyltransferase
MSVVNIALYEPEIPANTGNIIRLCANTSANLHLIQPLGFTLDDKKLLRAGLDYHEWTTLKVHANYSAFLTTMNNQRIIACSTKGKIIYSDFQFTANDTLLFGPETRGLPSEILASIPVVRIPMVANSRSLNLSNAVAIILYEAWRQLGFSS